MGVKMPDVLVAVRFIVLASRYATAAWISLADGLSDAFACDGGLTERIVINVINILAMAFWDNDNVAWIVDPPFRRNERDDCVRLQDDVIFLLKLGFVTCQPIAEWADVVRRGMIHEATVA